MKRLSKIICFAMFSVLLTSGFPNFMYQEAHASAPTGAFTGAEAGDSTNTKNIVVKFGAKVAYKVGTDEGTFDAKNFFNVNDQGAGVGITSANIEIENTVATPAAGDCNVDTITIVLNSDLATNATPKVIFTNTDNNIIDCDGAGTVTTGGTINTATDGLSPQFSSAKVASATTIQITFTEAITTGTLPVIGDFTLGGTIASGAVLTGTVARSGSTVTLTLDKEIAPGDTPTIAYTGGGTKLEDSANNFAATFTTKTVTNGLAAKSGGNGCNGDCEEPTLGVLPNGQRIVDGGFTYNGHSVDVERFFTPYPLITAQVGKQNTAQFKIYENNGPDNIAHFSFAFGLGKGQVISESKAMIEVDFARDRTFDVIITDPENALDNVSVTTDNVACNDGVTECLEITINHMFREPLDFNIVGTDVWDYSRQSWQNYYNHGIEVVGESLNPPAEFDGIDKGHIYHLFETGRTTAVDEFGNTWTLNYGIWNKNYVKNERIQDTDSVFTRMHSDFADAKTDESDKATKTLLALCPTCLDTYADFEDSKSIPHSEPVDRMNDPRIIQTMKLESERATKIIEYLLDPSHYSQ